MPRVSWEAGYGGHHVLFRTIVMPFGKVSEVYLRLLLLLNTIADGILGGVIIWEAQHRATLRPYYEYHNQLRLSECGLSVSVDNQSVVVSSSVQ